MVNPATQLFLALRIAAEVPSEKVDHTPLDTAPDLVAETILHAVGASGPRP
jgi:hypothetical protein